MQGLPQAPKPQPGQLIRRPGAASGGLVRGHAFSKPAVPVEVQIARLNMVRSVLPAGLLAATAIGGIHMLQNLLTASPNAQLVTVIRENTAATREAAVSNAQAVKSAAEASGCKGLCIGWGNSQPQPAPEPVQQYPDYYYQQPVQPEQPVTVAAPVLKPEQAEFWRTASPELISVQMGYCSGAEVNWQTPQCAALYQSRAGSAY